MCCALKGPCKGRVNTLFAGGGGLDNADVASMSHVSLICSYRLCKAQQRYNTSEHCQIQQTQHSLGEIKFWQALMFYCRHFLVCMGRQHMGHWLWHADNGLRTGGETRGSIAHQPARRRHPQCAPQPPSHCPLLQRQTTAANHNQSHNQSQRERTDSLSTL